jgi:hypothetical protein
MPVPMHMVTMPYLPPVRCRPCTTVAMRMAPVAPSGWPSAMAPPSGLTLAGLRPSSFITASDCAAKASLSSIQSRSSCLMPTCCQHLGNRRNRADAHDFRRHAATHSRQSGPAASGCVRAESFPKPASPRRHRRTSARSCRPSPNRGRGTPASAWPACQRRIRARAFVGIDSALAMLDLAVFRSGNCSRDQCRA